MSRDQGYPSSYDDSEFSGGGMGVLIALGSLGSVPDGYTGEAVVTTSSPAPAGDLKIHASADASSPQTGGASKNGVVVVTGPGWNNGAAVPGWVQISWAGDSRNPAQSGYVSAAYLSPGTTPVSPSAPAVVPPSPSPGLPPLPPRDPTSTESSITTYAAIGAGVVVVGGLLYWLAKRRKKAA